jgi:prevent-host-death family protein
MGAPKMKVSVRELKDRLSEHLRAVQGGQSILVTSHNKPVARLSPVPSESASGIERMLDRGIAHWNGKKPRGAGRRRPIKLRGPGKTMAEMVLADRG